MINSAYNAASQSLRVAHAQITAVASRPLSNPDEIAESFTTLQSAEIQAKVAVKTLHVLDDTTKSLLDILA